MQYPDLDNRETFNISCKIPIKLYQQYRKLYGKRMADGKETKLHELWIEALQTFIDQQGE